MKSTQGFTLIELLIVIAIIGILAAVLIPNLLGARQKANITAGQAFGRECITAIETKRVDPGSVLSADGTTALTAAQTGVVCGAATGTASLTGKPLPASVSAATADLDPTTDSYTVEVITTVKDSAGKFGHWTYDGTQWILAYK